MTTGCFSPAVRKGRGVWLVLALGMVLVLSIASRSSAAEANATDLHIGIGDTLAVVVRDHEDFGGTVTVTPDGKIRLPAVGALTVTGLTVDEVTDLVTTAYKRRLLKPEVFVTFTAAKVGTAYVLGAVKSPGVYPLTNAKTVLGLIVAANGLQQPASSCQATLLSKATGERKTINIKDVLEGVAAANLPIQDGDALMIDPLPSIAVYVAGEVAAPGLYDIPAGSTLTQALAKAGGIQGELTERRITLIRGKETLLHDAATLYRQEAPVEVALKQADVVRVESKLLTVTLAGEVKAPGTFKVPPRTTLTDALTTAGGMTTAGTFSGIKILHADGTTETESDAVIRDGDHVLVPTSTERVAVLGNVRTPGFLPFDNGHPYTITEAIIRAGGLAERSAPNKTVVTRVVDNKTQQINVKLGDLMSKYNPKADLVLLPGDVIFVPKSSSIRLTDVLGTISGLSLLRGIFYRY
ncbi:MAG: SLBB domain-containing protein [Armatimonadota bacterium]